MMGKRGEERRTGDSRVRKSRLAGWFWAVQPLEERALLALSVTTFAIPLVALVQPQGIVTGPDGNLWFTESGAGRIGRETPAGVANEFALPTLPAAAGATPEPPTPEGIAAGPDGALWFTTTNALIGRIGTDGTSTEFPAAGLASSSSRITAGPDGALWFTGVKGMVGRITTAGVVTEFPVPLVPAPAGSAPGTPGSQPTPRAITPGPDGALWFTGVPGMLGRIATAGAVTEFAVPAGTPQAVTTGPDGALWYTDDDGKVGRITTAGAVTEYDTPGFLPGATITTGPDGNLWFTQQVDNGSGVSTLSIGRISPAGVFTMLAVPGTANPTGLTDGPDGNLWFIESEDGKTPSQAPAVGKLTTAGAPTLFPLTQGTTLDPSRGFDVHPADITTGPDGALWFAEDRAIGRITTEGTITQFPLTTPGATPVNLTAGPDDAVWFTQAVNVNNDNGNRTFSIGRITTTGAVTNYLLATGITLDGITTGRHANLWFTETCTDPVSQIVTEAIGRITPQGAVTTFPLPIPEKAQSGTTLGAIVPGPDGNLWFPGDYVTRKGSERTFVAKITARNMIKMFNIDYSPNFYETPLFPPGSPTAGPDGRLWFQAPDNGIGRISTHGALLPSLPVDIFNSRLARLPNGQVWFVSYGSLEVATRSGIVATRDLPGKFTGSSYSENLTAGPDGNLWFTDGTAGIVRISGLDDTPMGGLDYRHRPKQFPDYTQGNWSDTSGTSFQTFAGVAQPGAEVTLWGERHGGSTALAMGHVQANPQDGSWTLKSHRHLPAGYYDFVATQTSNTAPPAWVYTTIASAYIRFGE